MATLQESKIEALIDRAVAGSDQAWMDLFAALWDPVEACVGGSRSWRRLRASADDRREATTLVFERLRRDRHRALRLWPEWHLRHPTRRFHDWLAIVTANVVRDYVAQRLGALDELGHGLKRLVDTLAQCLAGRPEVGERPLMTQTIAARQLLEMARKSLPYDQLEPLTSWLLGHDFDEIAGKHKLAGADAARAQVRAGLAKLRRVVREQA